MGSDIYDYENLEPIPIKVGIGIIICTMALFTIINRIVTHFGPPNVVSVAETWKWRNLFISWIHALIIGSWVVLCFLRYPELLMDLVAYHNIFCYAMVAVSTGYFFYDFVDVVVNNQAFNLWEVLVHHVAVAGIFFYNILMCRCIAFNVVALLAEVNTIFLHSRKLMQMLKFNYKGFFYRVNVYANLGTFLSCRFVALSWIIYGMLTQANRVHRLYYGLLAMAMFVMWGINIVLFGRLVKSDILRPAKHLSNKSSNGQAAVLDGVHFNNNEVESSGRKNKVN